MTLDRRERAKRLQTAIREQEQAERHLQYAVNPSETVRAAEALVAAREETAAAHDLMRKATS